MSRFLHHQRLMWLALVIGGLVGPPVVAAQHLQARPKQPIAGFDTGYLWEHTSRGRSNLRFPVTMNLVTEVEPNDSSLIATPAALGDTVFGVIGYYLDVDVFAIDLTAGTDLLLDVDANQYGSSLDPILGLFDVDGHTLLEYNDDADGLDSRLHYVVPATGRYYAAIMDYYGSGGVNYFYQLRIGVYIPPTPGPGDPTTPFALNVGNPLGIAAAPGGAFFVANYDASEVIRVSASGSPSTFAHVPSAIDVAIDSYGALLVAAEDSGVYRVDATGARSPFITGFRAEAIAIDAGGDVWVGGYNQDWYAEVRRHDARGALKATIDVASISGVADLAFSPAGILFATNGHYGVYQVSSSGVTPVILPTPLEYPEGIAFDRDGYVYISNGYPGEIHLYDPSFNEVGSVFARSNLSGPILLAFGQDGSGGTTSRLFATNAAWGNPTDYPGSILEVNQAGVRAPGFQVGFTRPDMDLESVADAFLGVPNAITPDQADFLDRQGNGNGRLDVADFRVFLRLLNATARMAGRAAP
jgi:hypothetical protein